MTHPGYADEVPDPCERSAPRSALQWLRLVGNTVNLSTPLGLGVAVLGRARLRRGPRGLVLADRYRLGFPIASAFTVGNVLLTADDWSALSRRRPQLLTHEEGHTWQYLYCLGLPFFPLYGLSLVWSWLRTGDRAQGNFFERQAGLTSGGYAETGAGWPGGPVAG